MCTKIPISLLQMISPVTTTSSSLQIAGPFSVSSGAGGGGGWYFASNTIPFGWKLSAYIYHITGSLVSHHLRSIGIPCSLYIDDRYIGQLAASTELQSHSSPPPLPESDFVLAQAALFLVCYFLSALGYCVGLSKSILVPLQKVPYLGFVSDSCLQAFNLIPAKKHKFIAWVRDILSRETVELVALQKLAGKCISMAPLIYK